MTVELKTSWLQLVENGSNGLIEAIDHLTLLIEQVEIAENGLSRRQEAADVFMEVQRTIMMKLISSDENIDASYPLIKFLDMFIVLWRQSTFRWSATSGIFCVMCKKTKSRKFSSQEVKQILDMCMKTSDQMIFNRFFYFFHFLWTCACYDSRTELMANFKIIRPVITVAHARWFYPILKTYHKLRNSFSFELSVYKIPNLLPTIIRSTTYLVNCWWLLHQADLIVESNFILGNVLQLIRLIRWLPRLQIHKYQYKLLSAGFGRLLRCLAYAIFMSAKTVTPRRFRTFLLNSIKAFKYHYDNYPYLLKEGHIFPLLSCEEMGVLLDSLTKEAKRHSVGCCGFSVNEIVKDELVKVKKIEDGLPPLSRADAELLLLPDYVTDAIDSLPCEATFTPKVGVFTLIDQNKDHLPTVQWTRDILAVFNRNW